MGMCFTQVIFSEVSMSIDLQKMEIGIDLKDLFHNRKGDQMIASKEDREFFSKKDSANGLPNEIERDFLLALGKLQIPHIMNP
jgi:hypothetical protein